MKGHTFFLSSLRITKGIQNFPLLSDLVLSIEIVSYAFCHIPVFFLCYFLMVPREEGFKFVSEHFLINFFVSFTLATPHFAVVSTSLMIISSPWASQKPICLTANVCMLWVFCYMILHLFLFSLPQSVSAKLIAIYAPYCTHPFSSLASWGGERRQAYMCTQGPLTQFACCVQSVQEPELWLVPSSRFHPLNKSWFSYFLGCFMYFLEIFLLCRFGLKLAFSLDLI